MSVSVSVSVCERVCVVIVRVSKGSMKIIYDEKMSYLALQLIYNQIHCYGPDDCLLTVRTLEKKNSSIINAEWINIMCMLYTNLVYIDSVDVHARFFASLTKRSGRSY